MTLITREQYSVDIWMIGRQLTIKKLLVPQIHDPVMGVRIYSLRNSVSR